MISNDQIRAARALLNWTQDDLAKKTGLSLRALNSIERGLVAPRIDNLGFIQQALEIGGIEFGENDGVRRRTERLDILKFEGAEAIGRHLLDIMMEMRKPDSEVLFSVSTEKSFAAMDTNLLDSYFAHLAHYQMRERLLFARGETFVIGKPAAYRWIRPDTFNHVAYVVYGDNAAFVIAGEPHRIIVLRNPAIAEMFRRQFELNWKVAEIPWFSTYPIEDETAPWSDAKAAAAREWIARNKPVRS